MKSGKISSIPKEVSFREAIEDYYPETRGEYIRSKFIDLDTTSS
jgi:Ras GTPase-activating-like protein IQGAP2/3